MNHCVSIYRSFSNTFRHCRPTASLHRPISVCFRRWYVTLASLRARILPWRMTMYICRQPNALTGVSMRQSRALPMVFSSFFWPTKMSLQRCGSLALMRLRRLQATAVTSQYDSFRTVFQFIIIPCSVSISTVQPTTQQQILIRSHTRSRSDKKMISDYCKWIYF